MEKHPPIVIIMREKDIPRRAGMIKLSAEKEQQLTAMLATRIRKGAKRLGPWRSPSAPRGRGRRTTHCTAAVQPQVPCPGGQAQLVDVAHPKVQAVHSWHLTTRTLVEATSICTPTLKFLYKSVPRSYAFHSQNKSLEVKIAYLTFLRCLLL